LSSATPGDGLYPPAAYEREDESADERFYGVPRKVVHIDDGAIAALGRCYAEVLPADGRLLDLMSSWRSHLPAGLRLAEVIGLGMNAEEMADNPQLAKAIVHDVNREPRLPFADVRGVHPVRPASGPALPRGAPRAAAGRALRGVVLQPVLSDQGRRGVAALG
jgi:hypothetical protein